MHFTHSKPNRRHSQCCLFISSAVLFLRWPWMPSSNAWLHRNPHAPHDGRIELVHGPGKTFNERNPRKIGYHDVPVFFGWSGEKMTWGVMFFARMEWSWGINLFNVKCLITDFSQRCHNWFPSDLIWGDSIGIKCTCHTYPSGLWNGNLHQLLTWFKFKTLWKHQDPYQLKDTIRGGGRGLNMQITVDKGSRKNDHQ